MKQYPQKGFVLWLTGLSGAGKSTIADALFETLSERNIVIQQLDGDIVRQHLTKDLGFSREDRLKNLERVAFVASLLSQNGIGVVASFISPYRSDRDMVRSIVTNFVEVFVSAPLEVCEKRDPKGLYRKARAGEIKNFTGISDPYEEPQHPDILLETADHSVQENVNQILSYLSEYGFI